MADHWNSNGNTLQAYPPEDIANKISASVDIFDKIVPTQRASMITGFYVEKNAMFVKQMRTLGTLHQVFPQHKIVKTDGTFYFFLVNMLLCVFGSLKCCVIDTWFSWFINHWLLRWLPILDTHSHHVVKTWHIQKFIYYWLMLSICSILLVYWKRVSHCRVRCWSTLWLGRKLSYIQYYFYPLQFSQHMVLYLLILWILCLRQELKA